MTLSLYPAAALLGQCAAALLCGNVLAESTTDVSADITAEDAHQAIEQFRSAASVASALNYTLFIERVSGEKQEISQRYDYAARHPDYFTLRLRSGTATQSFVLNESLFASYTNMTNRYVAAPHPGGIKEMWAAILGPFYKLGGDNLLQPLGIVNAVTESDAPSFLQPADPPEPMYADMPDDSGEVAWFRVRPGEAAMPFQLDAMPAEGFGDMFIAVEAGDQPRIRRIFQNLSPSETHLEALEANWAERGMPERHQRDARVMHSYFDFHNWRFNEPIDDELFYPGLEEEYAEVDHFMELLDPRPLAQIRETRPEQRESEGSPTQLVGDPAPDVELSNLDGDSINVLDEHAGEVVILDFWATWCPPCLRAIPDLLAVSDEYADQGVVFYAVNVREGESRIRPLLDARNWDLPVLLDSAGDVSHAYRADALPTTVIIGRDGVVRHVHVGAGSSYREHLTAALEQVLTD